MGTICFAAECIYIGVKATLIEIDTLLLELSVSDKDQRKFSLSIQYHCTICKSIIVLYVSDFIFSFY